MDNIHFTSLLNVLEELVREIKLCTQEGTSNLQLKNPEIVDQLQPKLAKLQISIKNLVLQNKGFVASQQILEKEGPRYQDFFVSIPIRCLVINTSGIIEEANKPMVAMLSASQGSLVGSYLYDHFPSQIAERMRERVEEVIRTGQDVHFRDDEARTYLIYTITPLDDQNGQRKRVAVLTYNDTSKMLEKTFCESEERYRQLVELSPDTIVVHTGGKVVYINAAGINLFGATIPEELIGKHILDLIHPEDREFVRGRIRQIDTEGTSTPLREYRIVRFGGEIVDVEAKGTRIIYQGKPSNLVIIRDITARKAAERDLKTLNEKLKEEQNHRNLLSKRLIDLLEKDRHEVAMELHDHIGQLLTTLKMDLEIISSELKHANQPLQYRMRSANKKTAYAIIDLKKIAHGLMPGMIINLGLVPSLQALIKDVRAHVDLKVHFFTKGIPERFDQDKELAIYRIAQEALSNIIKHAYAKQVFINLFKKDQAIVFGVEDDGIGFKIDEKMCITSNRGPLGLHIMRERIVQLGGEFTIDSRIGGGTHILVELTL